jgi:excisionase family DNA binding protein
MLNTKPNLPTYFMPEEVAAALRVTEPTVYEWLRSGQLEGVKAGKFWRVSQEALEAFLKIERGRGGRPKKPAAPPAGSVVQAEPEKPAAPPAAPPVAPSIRSSPWQPSYPGEIPPWQRVADDGVKPLEITSRNSAKKRGGRRA